jgi:Tfp pilus assembly protein PilV
MIQERQIVKLNKINNKGLTLVEVLIATVVTLVLFLALMQSALLSIELNTNNSLRDEAVRIAEERMRDARNLPDGAAFDGFNSDDADVELADADCPDEFVAEFGTNGRLMLRNIRNIAIDFCTNMSVTTLTADGRYKQVDATVEWEWKDEPFEHRISTIVRRPS